MAGPYPPPQPAEGQPFAGQPVYGAESYPYPPYPGPLPPPVNYPSGPPPKNSRRALWWGLGALAVVAALVAGVLLFAGSRSTGGSAGFTEAASKAAIQNYLDALSSADTETVARNNACGLFDGIKERRSDLALARLASDAFRKQFTRAEVTSIDKIVVSSSYQAQVLFTMKVASAAGSRSTRDEQQGQAQLLRQGNQLLVCSYLLRTAAQY